MDGEIDPEDLSSLLSERGDASADEPLRIVDIRGQRAFDRGHLPDSECIPFPELTSRVAELDDADRIVTVCPHGVASRQAAQLIGSYEGTREARVESLRGGIEAWEREVGELVTAEAEPQGAAGGAAETDEGPDAPF